MPCALASLEQIWSAPASPAPGVNDSVLRKAVLPVSAGVTGPFASMPRQYSCSSDVHAELVYAVHTAVVASTNPTSMIPALFVKSLQLLPTVPDGLVAVATGADRTVSLTRSWPFSSRRSG